MSWSNKGDTDFLTNQDVLTAVNANLFSLKAGQSVPDNLTFITKNEANAKLNINAIGGTGTDWTLKPQYVSATTYNEIANGYAVNGNYIGGQSEFVNVCFMNFISERLYKASGAGNFAVGDVVYVFEDGVYKKIQHSKNTNPANWLQIPNQVSWTYGGQRYAARYDVESSEIEQIVSCRTDNYIGWGFPEGQTEVYVNSQFPVHGSIMVDIEVQYLSIGTQTVSVPINSGATTGSLTVQDQIVSGQIIGINPSSDEAYEYKY